MLIILHNVFLFSFALSLILDLSKILTIADDADDADTMFSFFFRQVKIDSAIAELIAKR